MTTSSPSPSNRNGRVPRHVAVIMDGNGRWAADRELPRYEGHREGMKAVRETIEAAIAEGVEILTLFAFSTENWNRPEEEIVALMSLLQIYAHSERDELVEQGVQVKVLGDLSPMDRDTLEAVRTVEEATRSGGQLRLNLMVSYSGRNELLNAVRSLAREAALGALEPDDILPRHLEQYLHTRDLPDPDLLIRTSGEFRISNFMLWQLAYTEIHICPVLWPDFNRDHFGEAIRDYQRRERRFGRVTAP